MPRLSARLGAAFVVLALTLAAAAQAGTTTIVAANQSSRLPRLPIRHGVRVCLLQHDYIAQTLVHAYHAVVYFRSQYPHVTFADPLFLGTANAVTVGHGLGPPLVTHRGECTVMLGPGWSRLSQTVNLLVNSLWVDHSATSTALSDKVTYPFFNRVILTDADATRGVAEFFHMLQWPVINTLCSDTTYGHSVVQGITDASHRLGIRVGIARCIGATTGASAIDALLDFYATAAESRVIFVGVQQSIESHKRLIDRISARGMDADFVFVFSESACTGPVDKQLWIKLRGSLCATYGESEHWLPFQKSYANRSTRNVTDPQLLRCGVQDLEHANTVSSQYSRFAADAAHFAMETVATFAAAFGDRNDATAAELSAWARHNVTLRDGMTGSVQLDANGDRPTSQMRILNSLGDYAWQDGGVVFANGTVRLLPGLLFAAEKWEGGTFPTALRTLTTSSSEVSTGLVVGCVMAAMCALALLVGGVVWCWWRGRHAKGLPTDPAEPFTVLFFSVKNEAVLRDAFSTGLEAGFVHVQNIVGRAARAHDCPVVWSMEAQFMLVALSAVSAAQCAADVHVALDRTDWTRVRGSAPADVTASPDAPRRLQWKVTGTGAQGRVVRRQDLVANPLDPTQKARVSIAETERRVTFTAPTPSVSAGIWRGTGRITEETYGFSYGGEPVDSAAHLTDFAQPGQTLLPQSLADTLVPASLSSVTLTPFCTHTFSDGRRKKQVCITQLVPDGVALHEFTVPGSADDDRHSATAKQTPGGRRRAFPMENEADFTPGALTAALEQSSQDLTTRRVAVVVVDVPALRVPVGTRADQARRVTTAFAAVSDAAKAEKGELVSVADGHFIVAFNAASTLAQAATRAAGLALQCVTELREGAGLDAFAGLNVSVGVVGSLRGRCTVNGGAVERARFLATAARRLGLRCLAVSLPRDSELQVHFTLEAVDLVAWPDWLGGAAAGLTPLLRVEPEVAPEDAGDEDWIYGSTAAQVAQPFAVVNEFFLAAASATSVEELPPLPTKSKVPAFATSESSSSSSIMSDLASKEDVLFEGLGFQRAVELRSFMESPRADFVTSLRSFAETRANFYTQPF